MNQTPDVLAHNMRVMATDYNKQMIRIGELQKDRAMKLIPLMAEHGTKAKAEIYYNASPEGQELLGLSYQSKGLLELKRAVKAEIDNINSEQFGRF